MLLYNKTEIKEKAKKAVEVQIFRFTQQDRYIRGIHTDNTGCIDINVEQLPDEFHAEVQLMNEEEYEHTLLANDCTTADFEDWYGDKDAKVLVVAISKDDAEQLREYFV